MSGDAPSGDRERNVDFANDLLETEIAQRNERKSAQESTARWIVLTIVALMTLLLTLSRESGILDDRSTTLSRILFVANLVAAAATALCAGGTLRPRRYEKLGGEGLDRLNKSDFLDSPPHAVVGQVLATRIAIAKGMDALHELKAEWLTRAFAALAVTLALVVAQGIVLGIEPPSPSDRHGGPAVAAKTKASDGQGQQGASSSSKSPHGGDGIRSVAPRPSHGNAP